MIRSLLVLTVAMCLAGAVSFAQSGAATYQSKCQMCHGATGTPSAGMAKAMGIKPASDPSVKSLSAAEMAVVVKNGKGKMKPIAGLSDAQVSAVVAYYRSLK
jgi:mono/diheme cytochrome c family protein